MNQTTQHYYVMVDTPDLLEVGHPIVDEDYVIGFVYEVFDGRAEVMLWKPMTFEFKDNMENISEEVEDVFEKFAIAMVKAPSFVKEGWKEMLKNQSNK